MQWENFFHLDNSTEDLLPWKDDIMPNAPALVREAIRDRSACLQCIVLKTGLTAASVFYQLDQLKAATSEAVCDFCQEPRSLFRLA